MKLELGNGCELVDPDPRTIEDALSTLSAKRNNSFAILSRPDGFMQTVIDPSAGFAVEYQEGSTDAHFRASADSISLVEVVRLFQAYAAASEDWKSHYSWKRIDVKASGARRHSPERPSKFWTPARARVAAMLLWFIGAVFLATAAYGYFGDVRFWEEAVVVEVEVRDMRFVPSRNRHGRPRSTGGSYYVEVAYTVAVSTSDSSLFVRTLDITKQAYEAAAATRTVRVGYRPEDPSDARTAAQPPLWQASVGTRNLALIARAVVLVGLVFFIWATVHERLIRRR